MSDSKLIQRITELEFINDQLMSELIYIDDLLKAIGFPEGIETAKQAAKELKEMEQDANNQNDNDLNL